MARPSVDQYRSQLEAQIEGQEVKKAVAELRKAHTVFRKYPTIGDLLNLGRPGNQNYEDKDAVLAILLSELRRDPMLFPLLNLMFWESLMRIYRWKRQSVPDCDELFLEIQTEFFYTALKYPLDRRPRKIDVNLVLDTRKKITRWQKKEAAYSERHEPFDEVETPQAKRIWALADLVESAVFPDEEVEYLDRVYRGVISERAFNLIVETQVYKRMNLKEWARANGVPHATARSWLYRAMLALLKFEKERRDGNRLP